MGMLDKNIKYPENLAIELGFEKGELNNDQLLGINYIVCGLQSREKAIIYHRFVEQKTFKEVGKDVGLCDTRTRELLKKTIARIKKDKDLMIYVKHEQNKQTSILKRQSFIEKFKLLKHL